MKPILICLSFLFFTNLYASDFICISGVQFKIDELPRRAGLNGSYLVNFDVHNFKPLNISIKGLDSLSNAFVQHFSQSTIENINKIVFLKDTLNFNLIVHYQVRQSDDIANDFAELLGNNELRIVFRRQISKYQHEGTPFFLSEDDSLIWNTEFEYDKVQNVQTDILVQRFFSDNGDSSVIIKSNYPDISNKVLENAQLFSKQSYLYQIKDGGTSKAKWFFIRYKLIRRLEGCNFERTY